MQLIQAQFVQLEVEVLVMYISSVSVVFEKMAVVYKFVLDRKNFSINKKSVKMFGIKFRNIKDKVQVVFTYLLITTHNKLKNITELGQLFCD
jgi:hypothetical protein